MIINYDYLYKFLFSFKFNVSINKLWSSQKAPSLKIISGNFTVSINLNIKTKITRLQKIYLEKRMGFWNNLLKGRFLQASLKKRICTDSHKFLYWQSLDDLQFLCKENELQNLVIHLLLKVLCLFQFSSTEDRYQNSVKHLHLKPLCHYCIVCFVIPISLFKIYTMWQ